MKKYLLKKYDDGKIKFFKYFHTEEELLQFAKSLIGKTDNIIHGPVVENGKHVYWVDIRWYYHVKE